MALPFPKRRKEEISDEMPPGPPPPAFPTAPATPGFGLPPIGPDPRIRDLTGRGYPSADVLAGMEGAGMRPAGPPMMPTAMPPPPIFRPAPAAPARPATEEIEEIAEAIIAERWQKVSKELDDLKRTQEDLSSTISGVGERLTNLEKKMDMVIQEILGKVDEYGKGITDVGTELKAMQKVFGTVMPTFTENIKELQELVGETKKVVKKKVKKK